MFHVYYSDKLGTIGPYTSPRITLMTKKKLILSAGALLLAGLVIWIWLGRGPTETAGIHRVDADGDIPPAAVARVERHNVGTTLTIAGEFKPFQDVDVHAKVA